MSGHDVHEKSGADKALDAIRSGGDYIVMQVRQRVWLALDCLSDGNFTECNSYLGDAQGLVQALSHAQHFIAIADGSRIMQAADVEVGMTLVNVGEVTDVSSEDCLNERCRRHVTLKVGDHELDFRGNQEVYIALD